MSSNKLDLVQESALIDGIFLAHPNNVTGSASTAHRSTNKVHIFSSSETRTCLRDKRIVLAGDSYMKQMFIGLGDILLNDPSNRFIWGKQIRLETFNNTRRRLNNLSHINVQFEFESISYKDITSFMRIFNDSLSLLQQTDAFVVNSLVHHFNLHINGSMEVEAARYMESMSTLFRSSLAHNIPLTWATGPSYDLSKVPPEYRAVTLKRPTDDINRQTMQLASGDDTRIPVLDFFTLTRACEWSNCTADGGHRARFVNRMKAQMLLNNLCRIV
eukprot:gene43678-54265_t